MNYVLKLKTCPNNPALTPTLGLRVLPLFEDSNSTWVWLMTSRCLTPLIGVNLNPTPVVFHQIKKTTAEVLNNTLEHTSKRHQILSVSFLL